MKRIALETTDLVISFSSIDGNSPIFAERAGQLVGMVVHESYNGGWVLKIGRDLSAYKPSLKLRDCLQKGLDSGYVFYIA